MPRHCVAPGCKSNYDSTFEVISTFSFPKEKNLRQKWINAIHRADWQPTSYSSVCGKHFKEGDFEPSGKYKKPRLVYGVIPFIIIFIIVTTRCCFIQCHDIDA